MHLGVAVCATVLLLFYMSVYVLIVCCETTVYVVYVRELLDNVRH